MFTTHSGNGHLHSRPITTHNKNMLDAKLWFLMSAKGDTAEELTQQPQAWAADHAGDAIGAYWTSDARQGLKGRRSHSQGPPMNILMEGTSHDQLGDTGKKTGFWREEFAAPYYVFKDAGPKATLNKSPRVSAPWFGMGCKAQTADIARAMAGICNAAGRPKGGQPPLAPKSAEPDAQTDATRRFKADADTQRTLAHTGKLADVDAVDCDAAFYPRGHGPLWDLAQDPHSLQLIQQMLQADTTVAAVCHAPGGLWRAKGADGASVVKGKRVTGFTNSEEDAAGLTQVVPFLVQDMLVENGGMYSKGADWPAFVVTDGALITGQNPASSEPAARALPRGRCWPARPRAE